MKSICIVSLADNDLRFEFGVKTLLNQRHIVISHTIGAIIAGWVQSRHDDGDDTVFSRAALRGCLIALLDVLAMRPFEQQWRTVRCWYDPHLENVICSLDETRSNPHAITIFYELPFRNELIRSALTGICYAAYEAWQTALEECK